MTEAVFFALGCLAGVLAGWWIGAKGSRKRIREELGALLQILRSGNLPDPNRATSQKTPEIREMQGILSREWTHRSPQEEDEMLRALQRIGTYLRHRVESPLLSGLEGTGMELRRSADEALGAVEDLEFFLEDPPGPQEPVKRNLTDVVQDVTREFARQSTVLVKVRSPQKPLWVRVEAEPLKDAVFLVLHNAAEFGEGKPVEISLGEEGGKVLLLVRDQGPGFSAEGLLKATDPFYSTSPGGLGLGLPHARRAVNAQGGELFLRNGEGGGGEVEIRLPLAS